MPEPAPSSRGIHVAVLAFPFGTHAAPLLTAVRRLAAAAPNARFSFFSTAKSNSVLFPETRNDGNVRAYDISDGVPKDYVFSGNPHEVIEMFLEKAPVLFRQGMAAAETETGIRISCLVTDAFLCFADGMAAEMEVPWVAIWTAGACSLSVHHYTDLIRETVGTAGNEEQALSFIPGLSKFAVKDLPEGVVDGDLASFFPELLRKMGTSLPRASAVFTNSFDELEPSITQNLKTRFKHFLNVGPFNLYPNPTGQATNQDPHGCLNWLKTQKPESVAYISFGTVMTPPPPELLALAEGLEASGVPFIWSIKDRDMIHLPEGFLDRTRKQGMIVPWAPQVQLLSDQATGVFVTHCGWNSVMESIVGGVPMICRPFFGDQRMNGRSVEAVWGIGVNVGGGVFSKEGVLSCLNVLLVQEEGKKMRKNVRELKELAQKAVLADGSSEENFKPLLGIVSSIKP